MQSTSSKIQWNSHRSKLFNTISCFVVANTTIIKVQCLRFFFKLRTVVYEGVVIEVIVLNLMKIRNWANEMKTLNYHSVFSVITKGSDFIIANWLGREVNEI